MHKKAIEKHKLGCENNSSVYSALPRKLLSNNTSGVTGVSWIASRGKWRAQIAYQGKRYHLGYYVEKKDTIVARKEVEEQIY